MNICTWWWVRHCLKCQARKTLRLTVSWPIILMPLPEGPGIAISVDSFGPLPVTPRGKFYILLSPIVSAAEPTCWQSLQPSSQLKAQLTLSSTCILPSGDARAAFARTMASSFAQSFRMPCWKLLGVRNIATSSYYPNGNSGVERVNHTMPEMLAMVVNELQTNWSEKIPHVECAYNNSVSAATGFASNEVHMGRLPHLPLTLFERTRVPGHQSLARDYLALCDLATDRQQRAYDSVREHHPHTVSRVERRNSALSDAFRLVLKIHRWRLGVGV